MNLSRRRWLTRGAIALVALLSLWPQIAHQSVIIGSDTLFHFNRFYDTAMQLRTGHFSYFQTNFGFQQNGRVINAIYGPAFAFLNGLLLLVLHSWLGYQLVTSFAIALVGGWGMRRLAERLGARPLVQFLLAVIYLSLGWLPRWALAENMEAWGAALAPYLCLVAVRMIRDHEQPVKWLPLALVISITLQIYLLSTLIFVLTLVPFFILGLISTKGRGEMVKEVFKAVGATTLLTANIWGALLELMLNNQLATPNHFSLAKNALHLSQLAISRNSITPLCLALLLVQLLCALKWRKGGNLAITLIGGGILFVSSRLFPWAAVQAALPALGTTFQFPARLTIVAYPLLLGGMALTSQALAGKRLARGAGVVALALLATTCLTTSQARLNKSAARKITTSYFVRLTWWDSNHEIVEATTSARLNRLLDKVGKRSPDYLPLTSKQTSGVAKTYQGEVLFASQGFSHQVLRDGSLVLRWQAKHAGWRQVPVVTYRESQLWVNGQRLTSWPRSRIGVPTVYQHRGTNVLVLHFTPAPLTSILIFSALSGWLLLIGSAGYQWARARAMTHLLLVGGGRLIPVSIQKGCHPRLGVTPFLLPEL